MYYDDIYHPVNEDNKSVSNCSVVTFDSRTSSIRKKQNKAVDEAKKADKGYHCVKCIVNHRMNKVEVYDSGTIIGNKIRDPIYGNRLPVKVGSKDEYIFFKVRMTGLNPISPVTLYYDSPEHYERHFKTTLSVNTKQKWAKEHVKVLPVNNIVDISNQAVFVY